MQAKVKKEMERKFKQVEIQRRISFSNEVNDSRLKVLKSRDEVVNQVVTHRLTASPPRERRKACAMPIT